MKKKINLIIVFLFIILNIMANANGSAISVNTVSSQKTELSFILPEYKIVTTEVNGLEFSQIEIEEGLLAALTGLPEVPIFSVSIAVPVGSVIRLNDVTFSKSYLLDAQIYPNQNYDNPDYTFDFEESFYTSKDQNLVFPNELYSVSDIELMRDYQFITINIHPMRYYPHQKQLEIIEEISMSILHESSTSTYNLRPRMSRAFEPLYESLLANYNQIRLPNPIYQEPNLLVIYGQGVDQNYLNQYVTWKRQRGMEVEIAPASTDGAGTNTSTIKTFIQNRYNQGEVEFVLFMGACGTPSSTSYNVPSYGSYDFSDYDYAKLNGSLIGQVFIGRFVASTQQQLAAYVNKVLFYERLLSFNNDDWFTKSLLCGDSGSSGTSTYLINRYVKSVIRDYDPTHNFTEMYNPGLNAGTIRTNLDSGMLQFSHRGYLGMNGFPSQVNSLNNQNKLFNSVAITCSSGGMNGEDYDVMSRMTRLYSTATSAPIGAITAVGMQNSSTHTAWNNVLQGGIFYGLYPSNMATMGQAVLFAKHYIVTAYNSSAMINQARNFANWLNFAGDPSVYIFKTMPKTFITQIPTALPTGTQGLRFEIIDNDGNTVPEAYVTISQTSNSEITYLSKALSDDEGLVYINLDPDLTGLVFITISRADFKPSITPVTLNTGETISVRDFLINDISGNNNGEINPGETIHLTLNIKNYKETPAQNLSATLICESNLIEVTNNQATLGSIGAGAVQNFYDAFTFEVSPLFQDKTLIPLMIEITDGNEIWTSFLTIEVKGVNLNYISMTPPYVDPGVVTDIYFSLINNGSYNGYNLYAELISRNSFLSALETTVLIGNINQGQTITNIGPFPVIVSTEIYPGMNMKADLFIYNNEGFEEILPILIPVGNRTPTDPTGPDDYGYVIIASNDLDYYPEDPDAIVTPEYRWKSIRTIGTNTNITDTQGDANEGGATIDLPFTASYYGYDYDSIFICSNGWFTFEPTEQRDFRNYPLPGPIAPRTMIAPYWTDLVVGGSYGGGIYTYFDEIENAFIIQWDRIKWVTSYSTYSPPYIYTSSDSVTFQVIIYNPEEHATSLGDSPIKFQYHKWHPGEIGNTSAPFNYVTVGFQDQTERNGLTYVYDNQYTPSSSTITNGTALLITQPFYMNDGSYLMLYEITQHDQNGNGLIEPGEIVNFGISIRNAGLVTAEMVVATMSFDPEYVEMINNTSLYPDIEYQSSSSNYDYFTLKISEDTPNNTEIRGTLHYSTGDFYSTNYKEWVSQIKFTVTKPSITYRSYLINDYEGNNDGILDPGENVKLVVNIANISIMEIYDIVASITASNEFMSINESMDVVPKMEPNSIYQFVFDLTLTENISLDAMIPVFLTVTSSNTSPINQIITLGINTSGTLLQHYCNVLQPPGWTIQAYSSAWSLSQTNNAGGEAPEIKFTGQNVTGQSRYISPAMDARDISSVLLTFKHAALVAGQGNLTIKVNARGSASTPWIEAWEMDITESFSEMEVSVPINNGLGTASFQISFLIDGYFGVLENWFLDDIVIQTSFGNTSILKGQVKIMNFYDGDQTHIRVKAGDYSKNINEDGTYTIYLLPRIYPNFIVASPYFEGNVFNVIPINAGQIYDNVNFNITHRTPPNNLRRITNGTGDLDLQWDHIYDYENDPLGFQNFEIYKQINSMEFNLLNNPNIVYLGYDAENKRHIHSFTEIEPLDLENIYRYTIKAVYANGVSDSTKHAYIDPNIAITDPDDFTIVSEEDENIEPLVFKLYPNYPNPFNPTTNIRFSIPSDSRVDIRIYNIKGQLVKNLKNEIFDKGTHTIQWNGDNNNGNKVGSGIYFIKIQNEQNTAVRKSVLLK